MSLLREIQQEAISSNSNLPQLLRKCKYLSFRLDNDDFKAWINCELNGYNSIDDLPDYRKLIVNSKGHFAGAYGSELKNANIPTLLIPPEFRDNLQRTHFVQSVAALDSILKSAETNNSTSTLHEQWNPDVLALLQDKFYERMICYYAWKVIPVSAVASILDTIRTRILNFALEIEVIAPGVGEAEMKAPSELPAEKVHQIFNTTINGNVQNLASASSQFSQSTVIDSAVSEDLFREVFEKIDTLDSSMTGLSDIKQSLIQLQSVVGTPQYSASYTSFMGVLSDHIGVYGPILAPFLPHLSKLLS